MNEATIHRCTRAECRAPIFLATLKPSGDVIAICSNSQCSAILYMIPGGEFIELLERHLPKEGERRTLIVSLE